MRPETYCTPLREDLTRYREIIPITGRDEYTGLSCHGSAPSALLSRTEPKSTEAKPPNRSKLLSSKGTLEDTHSLTSYDRLYTFRYSSVPTDLLYLSDATRFLVHGF